MILKGLSLFMAFINENNQEINCKIIYYGPSYGGKKTTLCKIAEKVDPKRKLASLSRHNVSLYFDFVPLTLGEWKGFKVRLHLYAAPHDISFYSSHQLISTGADAVIFVADSCMFRMQDNVEAFEDLKRVLSIQHDNIPIVFQYNKKDKLKTVPIEEMSKMLNKDKFPEFVSDAEKGDGIMEPLLSAAKLALNGIKI
jgi:mutual gliding-motility protein MglA